MSAFRASARRDLLQSIVGTRVWTLAAAVALLAGLPLLAVSPGGGTLVDLSPAFSIGAWCVLVGASLLGAAAMSRERREGTWDLVLAAAEPPSATLWGTWVGLLASVAVLQSAFVLLALVCVATAPVDRAAVVAGVLGLWLVGCVGASVGLLAGVIVTSGLGASIVALLMIGAWVSLARSMQALGDPWFGAVGYALDPIRRAQECAGGGFALGGVITLAIASLSLAWAAATGADAQRLPRAASAWRARIIAALVGTGLAVFAGIALRGPGAVSPRIDLHSVFRREPAEALRKAVAAVQGPVGVALFTARGLGDPSVVAARQVVDRLRACRDAQGAVPETSEIDLLSPIDAGRAARALQAIQASEASAVQAWRQALDAALAALDRVCASGELATPLQQAAAGRPQGDLLATNLGSLAAGLQRASTEGRSWRAAFEQLAAGSAEQPLGDVEGAGRGLATELGVWARILREGADALGRSGAAPQRDASRRLAELSDACRAAQDVIDRLPPLRISEVAAALRSPPLVVVSTARGAAAVPAWRLLEGPGPADLALAGAFAAAEGAPRDSVVLVHAMGRSPLEATAAGADLAFMAEALRGARLRVEAWNPSQGPRPALRGAQRRAWIVVPPLARSSLEPDAAEEALLIATRRLLQEGQPVLVLVAPSVAASMGMSDPWSGLMADFGLTARSSEMVVQLQASSESGRTLRQGIEGVAPGDHPLGGVMGGATVWPMAVPLRLDLVPGVEAGVVARVPEEPSIWIEDDPRVVTRGTQEVPPEKAIKPGAVVPLLEVAQRGSHRVALAGGVAWVLSQSAAAADARGMPRHAGNRDLLVGTVRWLVGDATVAADAPAAGSAGRGLFAVAWLPTLVLLGIRMGVSTLRRHA
jgi:hypothetical protein